MLNRSPPPRDLVDMKQQVGRILVDPKRARLLQLIEPVPATEQSDGERAAARRRQHVPDAVADHDRGLDRRIEPRGRRQEQIRIGWRI